MSVHSDIRLQGGVPTLFANDVPLPGPAYVTYLPERKDYASFAAMEHRFPNLGARSSPVKQEILGH